MLSILIKLCWKNLDKNNIVIVFKNSKLSPIFKYLQFDTPEIVIA